MAALLDDAAFLEHVDAVGVLDGGEAVGDDEGGAVGHEVVEGVLDLPLGFGVHGGGGFVEQEDGGVFEQGAGDGEALFFAAGEFDAAFADVGVELVGEFADEAFGVGGGEGGPEFGVGGVAFGEQEVFADGAVEEEWFLGDVGEAVAQRGLGEGADGDAIDGDGAGGGFVKTREQREDGGFSRAGGADEGDGFSGRGVE